MARPNKYQLLANFFPDISSGRSSENEAAAKLSTLACEAVLVDMIRLYDKGFVDLGLGCLCVRLHKGAKDSEYLPLQDLQQDLDLAITFNDANLQSMLKEAIEKIEELNPDKCALVMLCDNTSVQLFPIDREFPAKSIQSMLEEFGA